MLKHQIVSSKTTDFIQVIATYLHFISWDTTSIYSGSNNNLIPCRFCRFAHLQRMELCIILIMGTF